MLTRNEIEKMIDEMPVLAEETYEGWRARAHIQIPTIGEIISREWEVTPDWFKWVCHKHAREFGAEPELALHFYLTPNYIENTWLTHDPACQVPIEIREWVTSVETFRKDGSPAWVPADKDPSKDTNVSASR